MLDIRAAQDEELDAAGLCIGRAFPSDADGVRAMAGCFRESRTGDMNYDPENTRVVLDGRVVGVALIHDRRVLVRGVPIRWAFFPLVLS